MDAMKFADNILDISTNGVHLKRTLFREGILSKVRFIGGDPTFSTVNLTGMTIPEAYSVVSKWRQTLDYIPAMLTTELKLAPLSHYVKSIDQNISAQMEIAISKLYGFQLTYESVSSREDSGQDTEPNSQWLEKQGDSVGTLMEMVFSKTKLDIEEQRQNFERRIEAREKLNEEVIRNSTETLQKEI